MSDELLAKVNRMDPERSAVAQKHCASICTFDPPRADEPFELSFRVGGIPHPVERDHFIQFAEFFANDLHLARMDFIPGLGVPEGTLTFKLPAGEWTLRAVTLCNLHGLWESAKTIHIAE